MVSRNIVAKQEDGEGDWIVSRVRKVHHGDAPYDSKHPIVTLYSDTQLIRSCLQA